MDTKRALRIVVASPSDVQRERDVLPQVIEELNRGIAADRGLSLELLRWETDSYPGFHPEGPQGLIDSTLTIEKCDVLIGIFWKRFGTPTKDAESGTEHEILVAYETWKREFSPQIMVYFNQKPYRPKSQSEIQQSERVLAFRNQFPKEGLYWLYKGTAQFERLVRQHLTHFIRQRFQAPQVQVFQQDQKGRNLDKLLTAYCNHLKDKVNKVYIVGETESRELEKVFVKLNIMEEHQRPAVHAQFLGLMDADLRQRRDPFAHEDEAMSVADLDSRGDKIKRAVKPDELLRMRTQAVVTGAPGCGKTTLLRYLALKTIDQRLPVFLELKTISEGDFQEARNNLAELLFNKTIAGALHLSEAERDRLEKYFFTRLLAGEVSIFLDGLDEVRGTNFFSTLCAAADQFVRSEYRNNALIISTRPYALPIRLEGLKEMEIAPLSERQVEEFLKHYYGDNSSTWEFLQHLRRHSGLHELCRVPFLLSIIAQLHRGGHQVVENRLELYRQIVLHLAVRLDCDKSLPLSRFAIADPEGTLKLDFLRHVACEKLLMGYVNDEKAEQDAARLVFTGDVLLDEAKRFLEREKRPEINPHLLAGDVKATPLLREVGVDVYAFAHLTIQEYLAAAALSRRQDCEKILCRAYFNPTLAEMEVLPTTLGLAKESDRLYVALEQLPDSLSYVNLRLRVRSLAYGCNMGREGFARLITHLTDLILQTNTRESPYKNIVLWSLSAIDGRCSDLLLPSITALLSHRSGHARMCAAEVLGLIGNRRAIAYLIAAQNDKKEDIRIAVIQALGSIGGKEAVAALRRLLKSKDGDVRSNVARALGLVGEEGVIGDLSETLKKDPYKWARCSAASALGTIGTKEAVEALLEAWPGADHYEYLTIIETLGMTDNSELVERLIEEWKIYQYGRGAIAEVLGMIGDERAIETLRSGLSDKDGYVRGWCAAALAYIGDPRVVPELRRLLRDEDSDVRSRACEALGVFRDGESLRDLINLASDEDEETRRSAIWALGEIGDKQAIDTLLGALNDEDRFVREQAMWSLGSFASEDFLEPLLEVFRKDAWPGCRGVAAEQIALIGGKRMLPLLVRALKSRDSYVREGAVKGLARIGGTKAVAALIKASKDSFSSVHSSIAEALGHLGGERSVTALVRLLCDKIDSVRESAAKALQMIDVETLAEGLRMSLSDKNELVRLEALRVVGYYNDSPRVLDEISRSAAGSIEDKLQAAAKAARYRYERKLSLLGHSLNTV
jgi:HEAT repeat protein